MYRSHPNAHRNLNLLHVLYPRQPLYIILNFFRPSSPALRTGYPEHSAQCTSFLHCVRSSETLSPPTWLHVGQNVRKSPRTPGRQLKWQKDTEVNKFRACSQELFQPKTTFKTWKSTGSPHYRAFYTQKQWKTYRGQRFRHLHVTCSGWSRLYYSFLGILTQTTRSFSDFGCSIQSLSRPGPTGPKGRWKRRLRPPETSASQQPPGHRTSPFWHFSFHVWGCFWYKLLKPANFWSCFDILKFHWATSWTTALISLRKSKSRRLWTKSWKHWTAMEMVNATSRNLWLLLPWLPLPAMSSLNTNELEKAAGLFL